MSDKETPTQEVVEYETGPGIPGLSSAIMQNEDASHDRQQPGFWESGNMVELMKEFINDPNLPIHMQKELKMYFGMVSRHLLFGNLQEKDEQIFLRMFYNLRDRYYNSLRVSALTDEQMMVMGNLEMVFRAVLTRAKGPARERVLQESHSFMYNITLCN